MAYRFLKPWTWVGYLLNFWLNASEILWAGSVEMSKTLSRTFESRTDRLQLWVEEREVRGGMVRGEG